MTVLSDLARSGHASAEASDDDDAVEGDATEASDFVRETYGSWLDGDPEPTAWYAEWYLEIMLGHLSRLRNPPVAEELATIRADYMALVRPRLPGELEQDCYIAGKLSFARSGEIEEILDRIDGQLEIDGSGLAIADIVERYRLSSLVRSIIGERITNRIASERGEPGRPPSLPSATRILSTPTTMPGSYSRAGSTTIVSGARRSTMRSPSSTPPSRRLAYIAGRVRGVRRPMPAPASSRSQRRISRATSDTPATSRFDWSTRRCSTTWRGSRDAMQLLLDAIEILLVEDGRGLTIPDVVAVDDPPPLARETTRRRLAGTLAPELRLPVP